MSTCSAIQIQKEVPFYVGKGTGNRAEDHLRLDNPWNDNEAKKSIIRQIHARGKRVLIKKVAEFTDERDAYIYEWAMIRAYSQHLTNITPGGEKGREKPAGKLLTLKEVAQMLVVSPNGV